jgi:polysaccharide pyruvyl transferase WcaK-like protein
LNTSENKENRQEALVALKASSDDDGLGRPIVSHVAGKSFSQRDYQIALLTPYDGGNLGDAAIQDAMIENIRRRLPDVRLTGICLNCENFTKLHGIEAFPLCETDRPFYRMVRVAGELPGEVHAPKGPTSQKAFSIQSIKKILRRVPFLRSCVRIVQAGVRELRHWIDGYRFLRTQDLLIVSGGGQLDEEWGGPWGHPFALFRWAMLARMAGVPSAVASIGTGKLRWTTSRWFVFVALRLAQYRSYRDKNSRKIAAGILRRTSTDPIVPDLAFGLSVPEQGRSSSIRLLAANRAVIAISPIAFGKPNNWPKSNQELYSRYLKQLTKAVSIFLERGYFLVMVSSSRGDDESVIPEILKSLDDESKKKVAQQIYVPRITTWRDYVDVAGAVDFLITSRLHSTILGFIARRPTIAISFDPKVDWVMEDLGQTEYLLHIHDFIAEDIVNAIDRVQLGRAEVVENVAAYQSRTTNTLATQYDSLAQLAVDSRRHKQKV